MAKFALGTEVVYVTKQGKPLFGIINARTHNAYGNKTYDLIMDDGGKALNIDEHEIELKSLYVARNTVMNTTPAPTFHIGEDVFDKSQPTRGAGIVTRINSFTVPVSYNVTYPDGTLTVVEDHNIELASNIASYAASGALMTPIDYDFFGTNSYIASSTDSSLEHRKREGLCPQCGEKGRIHHFAMVCSTHGVY